MDLNKMIERVRKNTDPSKVGMITSHLGVVRRTSRNGREVLSIEVVYDQAALQAIVRDIKKMSGIAEVLVETREGRLNVGEEIMVVVVAGDIRENVFPALVSTVNRIKKEASKKKEYCVEYWSSGVLRERKKAAVEKWSDGSNDFSLLQYSITPVLQCSSGC